MGSERLTPSRVGKMASKCLLFVVVVAVEAKGVPLDGKLELLSSRAMLFCVWQIGQGYCGQTIVHKLGACSRV